MGSSERTSQLRPPCAISWRFGQPSINACAAEWVINSISKPVCIDPPASAPPAGMRMHLLKWFVQTWRNVIKGTKNCLVCGFDAW